MIDTNGLRAKVAASDAPGGEPAQDVLALCDELDRLRALLSQPTPTAEPPNIADMAPGTTFRARRNNDNAVWHLWCWTGRSLMRIGASTTAQGAISDMDIDPSTIREVTPPTDGATNAPM